MNRENPELHRSLRTKIQQVRHTLESLEDHLLQIDQEIKRLESEDEVATDLVRKAVEPKVSTELSKGTALPIAAG